MYMMGLRNVKRQMDKQGTKVEPIPFVYNNKGFSCIFDIGVVPYQLILTTLGLHPYPFRFDIERGYLLVPQLSEEEMLLLIMYLQLKPGTNHKFKIEDMMIVLKRYAKAHILRTETISQSGNDNQNDDDKPYFLNGGITRKSMLRRRILIRQRDI